VFKVENLACPHCGKKYPIEEEIMEKFNPYEKLSKKEKRKLDQARRQTWGNLNPVTRKPENSRAYNRQKVKAQAWT
jgi:DNA replicative helicase MCM subunit Mcm2 (Cdc46/Mcm family)